VPAGVATLAPTTPAGVVLDLAAVLILVSAFACLGSKLFARYVTYYGIQSLVLAVAVATVAVRTGDRGLWVLAGLTLVIKAIAIPSAIRRFLLDRLRLQRDGGLAAGLGVSLILGAVLTALAYLVIGRDLLPPGVGTVPAIPVATAVILLGGLVMVVRRHAVAQLIGWLIIENGVVLGAVTLAANFPFIVEVGIFLDVVASVLIMCGVVLGLGDDAAGGAALRRLSG